MGEMANEEAAKKCITYLNGHKIGDSLILVAKTTSAAGMVNTSSGGSFKGVPAAVSKQPVSEPIPPAQEIANCEAENDTNSTESEAIPPSQEVEHCEAVNEMNSTE